MKPRTLIPLIIGLGVGFFAIKMGIDMVRKAQGAQGDMVGVLMSAKTIEVATPISESMLTTKEVPRSLVPGDAYTDLKAVKGRVTAMSISSGVTITAGMLAPLGSEPGLRAKIPSGYRAVSISATEESSVAGFLMPGARVDVFSAMDKEGSRTQLILSDVEIGAVGQSMSEVDKDGKTVRIAKSVTLFLKPDEVERLPAGKKNLRLALRGTKLDGGDQDDGDGGSFWGQVLAEAMKNRATPPAAEPAAPIRALPKQYVLEVVRGSEVEQLVFEKTGPRGQYQLIGENPMSGKVVKTGVSGSAASPPSPE